MYVFIFFWAISLYCLLLSQYMINYFLLFETSLHFFFAFSFCHRNISLFKLFKYLLFVIQHALVASFFVILGDKAIGWSDILKWWSSSKYCAEVWGHDISQFGGVKTIPAGVIVLSTHWWKRLTSWPDLLRS